MNARPTTTLKPFIYAYLRRLPGMPAEDVRQIVKELVDFTERRGFALAGVHYERRPSERLSVWAALITECRADRVTNIVVPSAWHFHRTPEVAAFMREELAEKIRGTVWFVDAAGTAAANEAAARDDS